eukprot:XP_014790363.1 PREDICTED: putative uncharacterized protein DDB_G0282133 [Octopus bimaculoides]
MECHPNVVLLTCSDATSERTSFSHTTSSQMVIFNDGTNAVSDYGLLHEDVTRNDRFHPTILAGEEDRRSKNAGECVEVDNGNTRLEQSDSCKGVICRSQTKILDQNRNDIVEACSGDVHNFCNDVDILKNVEEIKEKDQSPKHTNLDYENPHASQNPTKENPNNPNVCGNRTNANYGTSDINENLTNKNCGKSGITKIPTTEKKCGKSKESLTHCNASYNELNVSSNQMNTSYRISEVNGKLTNEKLSITEDDNDDEKEKSNKIHKSTKNLVETEPKCHHAEVSLMCNECNGNANFSHTSSSQTNIVNGCSYTDENVIRNDEENQRRQKVEEHEKNNKSNRRKPESKCQSVVSPSRHRDVSIHGLQTNILDRSRNGIVQTFSNAVLNFCNNVHAVGNVEEKENETGHSSARINTKYRDPGVCRNPTNADYSDVCENWNNTNYENSYIRGNSENLKHKTSEANGSQTKANHKNSEKGDKKREGKLVTKILKGNNGLAEIETKPHTIEGHYGNNAASDRANISYRSNSQMDRFNGDTNNDVTNDRFYPQTQEDKEDRISQKEGGHTETGNCSSSLSKLGSICQSVGNPVICSDAISSLQTNILNPISNDIVERGLNNLYYFRNNVPALVSAQDDETNQTSNKMNATNGNLDVSRTTTQISCDNSNDIGKWTNSICENLEAHENRVDASCGNWNVNRKRASENCENLYVSGDQPGNTDVSEHSRNLNYVYSDISGDRVNLYRGKLENGDIEGEEMSMNIHKNNNDLGETEPERHPREVPFPCNITVNAKANLSEVNSSKVDSFNGCSDVVSDTGHVIKDATRDDRFYLKTMPGDEDQREKEVEVEYVETFNSNSSLAKPELRCQSVDNSTTDSHTTVHESQEAILSDNNNSSKDVVGRSNGSRNSGSTVPFFNNAEDNSPKQFSNGTNPNYGNSDVIGNSTNGNYGNSEYEEDKDQEISKKIDNGNSYLGEAQLTHNSTKVPFLCNAAASKKTDFPYTSRSLIHDSHGCSDVVSNYNHIEEDVARDDRFSPKTQANEEARGGQKEEECVKSDNSSNSSLPTISPVCRPVANPPVCSDAVNCSQSRNDTVKKCSNDVRNCCSKTLSALDNANDGGLTGEISNRTNTNCKTMDVDGNRTNANNLAQGLSGNSTNASYGISDLNRNHANIPLFQIENPNCSDDQRVPAANDKIASSPMILSIDQQESFYSDLPSKRHFNYKGNFTWKKPLEDCSVTLSTNSAETAAIVDTPTMNIRKILRIGLSKRQKIPALHPYIKRRRIDDE